MEANIHAIGVDLGGTKIAAALIEVIEALVAGAVSLVHSFNPCLLILGGGVVDGLPQITEQVEEGIFNQCLTAATENFSVVTAALADEAGVIGAAALAMESSKTRGEQP